MATPQRDVVEFPASSTVTTISRWTPVAELPELLTPMEAGAWLGLGRDASYEFARDRGVRIGRRLRVPRRVLEEMVKR